MLLWWCVFRGIVRLGFLGGSGFLFGVNGVVWKKMGGFWGALDVWGVIFGGTRWWSGLRFFNFGVICYKWV